jgi:hypothetical protein
VGRGGVVWLLLGISACGPEDPPPEPAREHPLTTSSDLRDLKALILRDLQDPKSVTQGNGLPDRARMLRSLQSASGWRDGDFIPPLLAILDQEPEYRLQAAACLVQYERVDLDRRVAAHSQHGQNLLGGDLVWTVTVQSVIEQYQRTHSVIPQLHPANVDQQLAALLSGKAVDRLKAWIGLASIGWFAPWQEYGLDATALWKAARKDVFPAMSEPLVGAERALQFLALVRSSVSLPPSEADLATAVEWRLGANEKGTAGTVLLRTLATALAKKPDPTNDEIRTLVLLCSRPVRENLDLYQELIKVPDVRVHQLGWEAVVTLECEETFQILESRWKEPSDFTQGDAIFMFNAIVLLGTRGTHYRSRWLNWLIEIRPKLMMIAQNVPAWILATSSIAGREFGKSGTVIPGGFDDRAAQETTNAILAWYAKEKLR